MTRQIKLLIACISFIIGILAASQLSFGQEYTPGQLIVKTRGQSIEAHGMRVIQPLGRDRYLVELPADMSVEAGMLAVAPEVEYAEPNYYVYLDVTPNDPYYGSQWHHAVIGSEAAWDITTGDPNVLIGIVDTGIDINNRDIAPNMICGIDTFNPGASPYLCGWDTHYHGSHVAGIAAGIGNNSNQTSGLCWGCSVASYKFFNACGSGGLTSDAILAIDRAIADRADILNNSWGGGSFSQALLDTINAACDAGVLFVASSGNNGRDTDLLPHYPSSYDAPCIISVGNSTQTDTQASSSNYGLLSVDLLAPGTSIVSLPGPPEGSQSQKPHNIPAIGRTGTSMASPMVAGAAGLLQSLHPTWEWPELKAAILSSVDIIPGAAQTVSGGRLNLAAALGAMPPPPPPEPSCGDGDCNGGETCLTCVTDCGACPPFCGDGFCLAPEYCGFGKKLAGKTACSQDCPRRTGKQRGCCGDGVLQPGESIVCADNP